EIADGEVERIRVAGSNERRADGDLQRAGVAEVDAGKERGAIQRERREADGNRTSKCSPRMGDAVCNCGLRLIVQKAADHGATVLSGRRVSRQSPRVPRATAACSRRAAAPPSRGARS